MLLIFAAVSNCAAQVANNTSLLGTVTDATGNVVVGASVTILNEGTNETFNVVTNDQGYYAVSGTPFNVTIPGDVANIGRPNQRPSVVGTPGADCNSSHLTNCINASAFAVPAPFTFGNAARNLLYGPSLLNTDFSLFKNIPIGERARFEFRAEFFNLFNHPQLDNPSSAFGTGDFGSITSTKADNRDIQFAAKVVF